MLLNLNLYLYTTKITFKTHFLQVLRYSFPLNFKGKTNYSKNTEKRRQRSFIEKKILSLYFGMQMDTFKSNFKPNPNTTKNTCTNPHSKGFSVNFLILVLKSNVVHICY